MKRIFLAVCCIIGGRFLASAQAPSTVNSLQASNVLNPNVSAVGWFQGNAGQSDEEDAFQLKEIELGFQAFVDPYARADIFVAVGEEEVELEEGYITWLALPFDLTAKAGRFKNNFGKFNRVHTPETAFADRPLVHEAYFGEEGLAGNGLSVSWTRPTSLAFWSLDLEAINTPEEEDVPAFGKAEKKELTYVSRLGSFVDLNESANVAVGASYAFGAAGQEIDAVTGSSTTLDSRLMGADLTFRWKNPRSVSRRSLFWTTEIFWSRRDVTTIDQVNTHGWFTHLQYQFARRWLAGARYDESESPVDDSRRDKGGLAYITFLPSEFSLISLQGRLVNRDGTDEDESVAYLKTTFFIGPHAAHPYY